MLINTALGSDSRENKPIAIITAVLRVPATNSKRTFTVIFDVEALFLYAWSVSVRETGWAGFIEVLIFISVLLAGLVYVWKIGALDWSPAQRRKRALRNAAKSET